MRWYILSPVAAFLSGWIWLLELLTATLGALRFFVVSGASPGYLLGRKRWFEEEMLGRRMGMADALTFGRWNARQGGARRALHPYGLVHAHTLVRLFETRHGPSQKSFLPSGATAEVASKRKF